jgi:CRP-like cAMP-binding protein
MVDMDFTKPQPELAAASAPFKAASSRFYDASAAAKVFREAGKEERFAAGQLVFGEDEKAKGGLFSRASSRMYYLAEGEVALSIGGKPLDIVKAGEVFGEMAVISGRPRSASATARGDVLAYSMDASELQRVIAKYPEFALMLASVMYDRLRFLAARLAQRPSGSAAPREATVFEPALVTQLEAALPKTAVVRHRQETVIFKEGGRDLHVPREGGPRGHRRRQQPGRGGGAGRDVRRDGRRGPVAAHGPRGRHRGGGAARRRSRHPDRVDPQEPRLRYGAHARRVRAPAPHERAASLARHKID